MGYLFGLFFLACWGLMVYLADMNWTKGTVWLVVMLVAGAIGQKLFTFLFVD